VTFVLGAPFAPLNAYRTPAASTRPTLRSPRGGRCAPVKADPSALSQDHCIPHATTQRAAPSSRLWKRVGGKRRDQDRNTCPGRGAGLHVELDLMGVCSPKLQMRMDAPASKSPLIMVILRLWSSWLRKAQMSTLAVSSAQKLLNPPCVLT
jgi:hypothetical protein